jgi:transmembrane sensor
MAVEWMVLLRSGHLGTQERTRFDAWRAANPAHQAACDRITQAFEAFSTLRERGVSGLVAHQTMQGLSRRSMTRGALGLAGLGAGLGGGLLGWRLANEHGLLADQSTGLAQRHQEALPDGSTLWMDARTALDVAFNAGRRTLTLRHGRLLVHAAAAGTRGPLQVQTSQGQVITDEAQFVVQQRRNAVVLQVTALKGHVEVIRPAGPRVQVPAGRHVTLVPRRAPALTAARGSESLWTRGLVAMANQPLGELIEALRDYRPGLMSVDRQAAQIPISGIFSLDDTDGTLRALAETQPVRISMRTSYWVTVEAV